MPSVQLSPGILIKETDLSQITRQIPATAAAIVIWSSKGPVMTPTPVVSKQQFIELFGEPHPSMGTSIVSALEFLTAASPLYVIRVAQNNSEYASEYVNVPLLACTGFADFSSAIASPVETGLSFESTSSVYSVCPNQYIAMGVDPAYVINGSPYNFAVVQGSDVSLQLYWDNTGTTTLLDSANNQASGLAGTPGTGLYGADWGIPSSSTAWLVIYNPTGAVQDIQVNSYI